jgi:hypothetical protein
MNIQLYKQPDEFFQAQVALAIQNQKKQIKEFEEFYLTNLLASHCRNSTLLESSDDEPLIIALNNAQKAKADQEKIVLFRKLGDLTLFVTGFFPDNLKGKQINIKYYKTIGKSAYKNLSVLERTSRQGAMFFDLYENLANKFQLFMDILAEVSDNTMRADTDSDLFKLYDHWIKTKSPRALTLLRRAKIVPINYKNLH